MKNVHELIQNLSSVFEDLKAGAIKPSEADSLANLAGKMISASKVQVDYYTLRKEKPVIDFLDASSSKQIKTGTVTRDAAAGVVRHKLDDDA